MSTYYDKLEVRDPAERERASIIWKAATSGYAHEHTQEFAAAAAT